jgi:pseudaminic acid cytidylyltransferase
MRNLAIIPARGGSKRIPKKNIRDFLGKPIIAYSIEAARNCGLFQEVMVSTESEEIASVAKQLGASIPFLRSKKTADDIAPLNEVYLEVVSKYKDTGVSFDTYCLILPTAPLLTADLLYKAYEMLQNTDFDSIRPVVPFEYPIQRAFMMNNSKLDFLFPDYTTTRSQDLEKAYHDAGMFYFIKGGKPMGGNGRGGFEIDPVYAQDIDSEEDWRMAELKYKFINDL